jgi:hypothetical protein
VAAGTWTAVSNRVARRQYNRWSDQDAQQAQYAQQPQYVQQPQYAQPAAAPNPADDRITKLKQLGDLKANGILTEEEFATEKARVLGS